MINSVQQNYGKQQVGFGAKFEIYGATGKVKQAYAALKKLNAEQGIKTAFVDTYTGIRKYGPNSDIKPTMLDKARSLVRGKTFRPEPIRNRKEVHCTDRVVITTTKDVAELNEALSAKKAGERYEKKYGKVLEREYYPLPSKGPFNLLNTFMEVTSKSMQGNRDFERASHASSRYMKNLWKAGQGKWIQYSNNLPSHHHKIKTLPSDTNIKATEAIEAIKQGTFDTVTGLKKEAK